MVTSENKAYDVGKVYMNRITFLLLLHRACAYCEWAIREPVEYQPPFCARPRESLREEALAGAEKSKPLQSPLT